MSKKKAKKETKFITAQGSATFECLCCGENKKNSEFLTNRSYMYRARGRVATCNNCIEELYEQLLADVDEDESTDGNKIALYNLCKMFDYMYSESLYKGTIQQAEKLGSGYLLLYLQKIGSLHQYRFKRFKHSDDKPTSRVKIDFEDDFILTKDIVGRWGKQDLEDYIQLENFFQQMVESSGCEDPIKENTLKNISKTQLKADKALAEGNIKDYTDLAKLISTMMKDGGVTPSSRNNDNDEKAMIGMWTKMIEEDEPIPEPLGMFQDVDRLGHYVKKWFVQHFARVFGVVNDNDVDYEEQYKEPAKDETDDVIDVECEDGEDK